MKKIIFISLFLFSCGASEIAPTVNEVVTELEKILVEAEKKLEEEKEEESNVPEEEEKTEEETKEEEVIEEPSIEPIEEEPVTETVLVKLPDNCSNPPKDLVKNGGTKVMGSTTRGGSVVVLLDYSLTWKPWKDVTDHHNQTYKVNKNGDHFDKVDIVLKNKERISLKWAGYHNPVYLFDKKVARQHFRNESVLWDSIKNRADYIEMTLGEQKTCLKI